MMNFECVETLGDRWNTLCIVRWAPPGGLGVECCGFSTASPSKVHMLKARGPASGTIERRTDHESTNFTGRLICR